MRNTRDNFGKWALIAIGCWFMFNSARSYMGKETEPNANAMIAMFGIGVGLILAGIMKGKKTKVKM